MSDRRPLRFWQPFNDWWRSDLERLGRRPNAQEIVTWYHTHAYELWGEDAPSIQETRVHAKCLRSLPLVRDYFRSYRAKKKGGAQLSGSLDDGEDDAADAMDTAQGQDWSTPRQSKRARRITQPRQHASDQDQDQCGWEGSDGENPDQGAPAQYGLQHDITYHEAPCQPVHEQLETITQQQDAVKRYLQLQQQQSAQYQQQLALAALAQQFAATKAAKTQQQQQQAQQGKSPAPAPGPQNQSNYHAVDGQAGMPPSQPPQQTSLPDPLQPGGPASTTATTQPPHSTGATVPPNPDGMGTMPAHDMQGWQQPPPMFNNGSTVMGGVGSFGGSGPLHGSSSLAGNSITNSTTVPPLISTLPILPGSDSYEQLKQELGEQQQHLPLDQRHELQGLSRGQLVELVIKLQQNKTSSCAGSAGPLAGHPGGAAPGSQTAAMMVLPEMMLGQGHAGLQQQQQHMLSC